MRHVSGSEIVFHFRSTAAAKAALAKVERGYAGCRKRLNAAHLTDVVTGRRITARVDRTATVRGGVSYLTTLREGTRLADPANLPSDAQELFVQRGNRLVLVRVDGFSRAVDSTKGAQHTLRTLANRLG
ncbi:hypothetical protein [Streptacidiphilus monticola]|uniref:Uncharacterized protein n=1 Tax=Streptacidiphilus monticola TaxID=2161674 RepID=A0ABW1G743_9ACTN